jgi:hypothetical protein
MAVCLFSALDVLSKGVKVDIPQLEEFSKRIAE